MKIDKMEICFLNSANYVQHTYFTSAPPSSYTWNVKTLTKVSKVSWSSQLSYKKLRSSFERKFRKEKLHFSEKIPPKSRGSFWVAEGGAFDPHGFINPRDFAIRRAKKFSSCWVLIIFCVHIMIVLNVCSFWVFFTHARKVTLPRNFNLGSKKQSNTMLHSESRSPNDETKWLYSLIKGVSWAWAGYSYFWYPVSMRGGTA